MVYDRRVQAERELVEFVNATDLSDVPADARSTVHRVVMAVVGAGVAGAGEDGIDALRRLLVTRCGRGEATSMVFGDALPATSAALLNGTMCRALDFCDAIAPGAHVGSSVVPAALATAELVGSCTGHDLVSALAVGIEVGARFNLTEQMYDGFDPTGIASIFGAAAAAGRLLRLDDRQMLHALALAFDCCGGSFQSNIDGSLAVRLQQGFVAERGVLCAQLAQVTGPVNFLEGRYGFTHLYAKNLCEPSAFVDAIGHEWRMNGFMFKKFPSCGVTQGVTQQALDVAAELQLGPADVEHVEVRMPPYSHRLVGNPFSLGENPRVNAQFSVQYCVANAIVRGAAKLEHFRPDAVADPALLPMIERVEVIADASMDARGHSSVDLDLLTRDGRRASRRFDVSPGYPGNGLDDAEHRARFDDCMAYAAHPLPDGQVEQLVEAIAGLDRLSDVGELTRLLVR
ncbi:MAG: MmgE/PrpD family protein [Actinobacteria bacterium]|nr:MmgE/PrpD family protein [Actinomycetota bacterium]